MSGKRPVGVDLFAGVGGMSLGFEQAGFDVVAAVEIDPIHAAAHAFNFPNCHVIAKSVSDLTGDQIRTAAELGQTDIDVLFGGAPCQGFSLIGHRVLDDPRNSLVRDFVRLTGELKPKFVVFENVKGLTVGRHREFLRELIEALEGCGYKVRAPWKVLDAADYGVPQHRERLILIGARDDVSLPDYPAPRCRAADRPPAGSLPAGPTCRDALADIPDADRFATLMVTDAVRVAKWEPKSAYAKEMHCASPEAWHLGYQRVFDPSLLTASTRTVHSEISRGRFGRTEPGAIEPISRFYKLPPSGLSNTLRAGTDAARGAFTSPRPVHFKHDRCVTVREMARLHGFPDWFRFHETKWHGARQIGNAVAPPLARAIGSELVKALGKRIEAPSRIMELGPERLLTIGMSEAAAHFGVANPIAKRNMKSGAKKRKQWEIEEANARPLK